MKLSWNGSKRDMVKGGTSLVVSVGVSGIVNGIVQSNVPKGNIPQVFCVYVGKVAISSLLSQTVIKHTDEQIDYFADLLNESGTDEKKDANG